MRKLLPAAALTLLLPFAASAQFHLDATVGYGIPMGEISKGADMKDLITGAVPMELTARFDATPAVSVGAYAAWSPGFLHEDWKDLCDSLDEICRVYGTGLGLAGEVGFGDGTGLRPFVGARAGIAWLTFREAVGEGSAQEWAKVGFRGWEAGLQAGVETKTPDDRVSVGAFVGYTVGKYSTTYLRFSDSAIGADDSADIPETAMHQWLTIGFRCSFGR